MKVVALLRLATFTALHRHERELGAAVLMREAVLANEADAEVLNTIAECLLNAKRATDYRGLNDV